MVDRVDLTEFALILKLNLCVCVYIYIYIYIYIYMYIYIHSWVFFGRTDAEAETPILLPPDVKNWLTGKDLDAGKDWRRQEKGMKEDEMVGWHCWCDGHEVWELMMDTEAWYAAVHGFAKSQTWLTNWTELINWLSISLYFYWPFFRSGFDFCATETKTRTMYREEVQLVRFKIQVKWFNQQHSVILFKYVLCSRHCTVSNEYATVSKTDNFLVFWDLSQAKVIITECRLQ